MITRVVLIQTGPLRGRHFAMAVGSPMDDAIALDLWLTALEGTDVY